MFSEPPRRGQPPGCASLSLPGRRRVPARSPGLGGQEGKFDQAVGEERDALLGDAGNLQPVLQDVEFHRPPALRGGSSAGGEPRPPPPERPAGTERRGRPARGPGARRRAARGGQRGGPPSREGPRAAGRRRAGGGRGRQRWRSGGARRPARRAAGVRCNKQLATQTPARWACAAAAGRAGTCSRARPRRRRLGLSGAGRLREGPAGRPRKAGTRAPAGPQGGGRRGAGLGLVASSHSELGTGRSGVQGSSRHSSGAGGGPGLGGDRFGKISG